MGKNNCEGHALLSLVCGVTEHQTLISCAAVIIVLILPHSPRDVWALLLERHHQGESLVVKPFAGVIISNVLHCVPHNLLIINMSLASDLSAHHDHSSLCHCLAGNLSVRILLEMSIQDCVRHLVAHLVRVALPTDSEVKRNFPPSCVSIM